MKSVIPIGPFHPLQEEPELFLLEVEGEKVKGIEVRLGYNHRGIEKLCQTRTFEQDTFLVERICGICSNSHPLAYVQAVEEIAAIEVPARARFLRTVIAELERLHSHLLWLGLCGHFLGYNTLWMWAWKAREPVLETLELLSGNRNHYGMMKIGGVRRGLGRDKLEPLLKTLDLLEPELEKLAALTLEDPVIRLRLKGIGVLTKEAAQSYGALGPTARASGVAIDVRKDHPYAAYAQLDFKVVVAEDGDALARTRVRLLECGQSVSLIRQALKKMPEGPVETPVKEIPAGEGLGLAEAPRGEVFHYVRSDGSNRPVRHKIRPPSFMNLPTCSATVIGAELADAAIILAAIDPCYCCAERMATVNRGRDKPRLTGEDLIRLSREKSARIKKEMG
jgi:NADH-quinone oxidoreductase subunit D